MDPLYIFHVARTDEVTLDDFGDFVCLAHCEADARAIYPRGASEVDWYRINELDDGAYGFFDWTNEPQTLKVTCIGVAIDGVAGTVVCASYHAG